MNRLAIEKDVAVAYHMGDREKVKSILEELQYNQSKLDRWFDKYLDMFDEKMSVSMRSDPVWKLYHQKYDLYDEIKQAITNTKYYLGKM